jgi:hypothetical protein
MVQNNLTKKGGRIINLFKEPFVIAQNRDFSGETNPDAFQHLQLNHP